MRPLRPIAVVLAAVALASCGGGGDEPPKATCHPDGTELRIVAEDLEFDTECLAAPAGDAFTLEFDNRDAGGTQHNVAIYDGDEVLYRGEIFGGGESQTYEIPALDAGAYTFQCDVHPTMDGAFVVE